VRRPRKLYNMLMSSLQTLAALAQIILIDITMSGDNAIAIGMAASGLPEQGRRRAVLAGILSATALRVVFAVFAVQIMHVTGLLAAGGLLLLWVSWQMYRDIRHAQKKHNASEVVQSEAISPKKTLMRAIMQIVIADVSMSLDNVLAVAGVARDHMGILAAGLALSILLMAAASAVVARITARRPWIAYLGLAVVLYTALHMMWDGAKGVLI
jgi:YjbE family integral membrane protein